MAEHRESRKLRSGRSRILYEITGLVVILMLASGFLTFFFVNSAFNRLVDKSIDKVVEEQAQTIHTGLKYVADIEVTEILGDYKQYTVEEMIEMTKTSMETGEISELSKKATERLLKLVEEDVLGVDLILDISLARPPIITEDVILVSTDEELFNTKPPEAVLSAIDEAKAGGPMYVYLEEGLPELGLEGEYLMSLYDMSQVDPLFTGTWGVQFVPMHETVTDIREFYDSEKTRATWIIALIIGGSVLLVILITVFVLSFLIRREITDPVDTLSAAAGKVMEGNLDVEIEVHEGGDFEGLERAFKEMVESIRSIIARSMDE